MKGDVLRFMWGLPLNETERRDVNHIAGQMREPRVVKTITDIVSRHAKHIANVQSQANPPSNLESFERIND
jgi:hypothetical protein